MKCEILLIFYVFFGSANSRKSAMFQDQFTSASFWNRLKANATLYMSPQNSAYSTGRGRSGYSTDTDMCDRVTGVPRHLTFITRYNHYRKYTHAYNIPIISTSRVQDAALKRACYVLKFLLADRKVLRDSLYRNFGRVGIMAVNEGTTSIPEHRWLGPSWDQRARGLGGTLSVPISTGGEENLLCWKSRDRYPREDIFLHEFSHGIQEVAVRGGGIPGYFSRLTSAYNYARSRGLWRSTYAMSTVQEYFAEGVQSFFNVNDYSRTPNGIHGPVNTRSKLRTYDPTLFRLIKEVFPCMNIIKDRCDKSSTTASFRMNCDGSRPVRTVRPPSGKTTTTTPSTKSGCQDLKPASCVGWKVYCSNPSHLKSMQYYCKKTCGFCGRPSNCNDNNPLCGSWASRNECTRNPKYMLVNCKKSCNRC